MSKPRGLRKQNLTRREQGQVILGSAASPAATLVISVSQPLPATSRKKVSGLASESILRSVFKAWCA